MNLRILSSNDVRKLLSMKESIDVMCYAFTELVHSRAHVPLRTITDFENPELKIFYKPCYLTQINTAGIKLLTQTNGGIFNPTIQGLNILVDMETGCFLSVLDGTYLTALRTGATSGLATKYLAREDAKVAAIFGAGAQGRTQLEAVCTVREIERAYIFDTNKNAVEKYIVDMKSCLNGTTLLLGENLQQLKEVDIICTATGASAPLFSLSDIKPGVHINAIGSYKPHMQEIAPGIMKEAKVYVDQKSACLAETGDFIKPIKEGLFHEKDIVAELGEVVVGEKHGRGNEQEITVFKSVGIAVQDLAAAYAVYQNAVKQDVGVMIEI